MTRDEAVAALRWPLAWRCTSPSSWLVVILAASAAGLGGAALAEELTSAAGSPEWLTYGAGGLGSAALLAGAGKALSVLERLVKVAERWTRLAEQVWRHVQANGLPPLPSVRVVVDPEPTEDDA